MLLVLCAAAFMASLDVFIVNVAFTAIGHDYRGTSLSDLSWILNAYAIVYAALLVPLGRLSDRYGRKAAFLLGLAVFTIASAACAASPDLWWLVSFRVLQAAGAAALTPTSLGLLLNATAPERRARAVRIWATSGALAAAVGPVIGGLLVEAAWQWVFIVNVPVGIVAFIAAAKKVPDSRDPARGTTPDLAGAAVLAIAIGALALGLVKAPDWGWTSGLALTCAAVTLIGIAIFTQRMFSHPHPVLEPALLRVRAFAWSNATAVLFNVAFGASLLAIILYLQDVWGYSALKTGLAVLPGPLMVPVFAAVSQRVAHRVPAGVLTALGCGLIGVSSIVLLLSVGAHPSYATEVLPSWLIAGAGVGFAMPTIMSSATADLPPARAATGSAVVNMSRQIGLVLGVSILIALLGSPVGFTQAHRVFQHGWLAVAIAAFAAMLTALGMTPQRRPTATAP